MTSISRARPLPLAAALLLALVTALAGMTATPARAAAKAPVDLNVSVTRGYDTPTPNVAPGAAGTYVLRGRTARPDAVDPPSVRVSLTLPAGVSFVEDYTHCEGVGCTPKAGPCEAADATVTCTVVDPQAIREGVYEYGIRLLFAKDLVVGTKLALRAEITSAGEEATPADNTTTYTSTVVRGADFGVTVEGLTGPAGPQNTVAYTLVVHNFGPSAVTEFAMGESFDSFWNWGSTFDGPGAECIGEAVGSTVCQIRHTLAPGQDYRLERTIRVLADDPVWGTEQPVSAFAIDQPEGAAYQDGHGGVRFEVDFTGTPNEWTPGTATPTAAPTASASPTPTAGETAAPAPGTGTGGDGGGLPITGSATVPLALAGLLLLTAGAGAVLATRRQRRRL